MVAAKAKATAKAQVRSKVVPKSQAKSAALVPAQSGKAVATAKPEKSSKATNGKKSIVSVAVKKAVSESKAPVVVAKTVAKAKKAVVGKVEKVAAKTLQATKPAAAVKPVPQAAAKPAAPVAAKPVVAVKPAPAVTPKGAAKPEAKAAAPAVVVALNKLPIASKPAAQPARPVAPAPAAKPIAGEARPVATKATVPVADPKKAAAKPANQRHGFKTNEYIVYPSHGVGKIVRIEEQVVAGYSLELFVIHFEQEKMTLRVPTAKLASVGMRKLSEGGIVDRAMETLKGRARIKRTMWSRRAQEYEAKINSGDLVSIAEVVRDLYRAETQPEQSYSERQLFEAALDRMSREIAAIENLDDRGATQKVIDVLAKSAKSRKPVDAGAEPAISEGGAERAA
jgi:CarD family transcriptional regulator